MKCSQGKNIHWISFTTEKSVDFFPIPHRGSIYYSQHTHRIYQKFLSNNVSTYGDVHHRFT